MKLMIASDIHGSALYAGQMVQAFAREAADRLLLLGDLLYHGPRNPLPEGYDPAQVYRMLNGIRERVLAVRGNCDSEVDQMVLEFPILADYALLSVDGSQLFATHGHVFAPENPPPMAPGTLFVSGHTHVPTCDLRDGCAFVNPGSVSLPKDGTPRGYMVLEGGALLHRALDGAELARYTL